METKNIFSSLLIGGIFLIPIIPLVVTEWLFSPYITGKMFFFRLLIEVLAVIWLFSRLSYRDFRIKFSPILTGLTAFLLIVGVANLLGINPVKSFWGNLSRMDGFVSLLHLFALFIITVDVLRHEKLWERLFLFSVAISSVVSLGALIQLANTTLAGSGVRVDAFFGNPTYLAVYVLLHIFIALWFLIRHRSRFGVALMLIATIIINSTTLYWTLTRGAFLGLIGGLLISAILIILFERQVQVLRKVSLAALLLIVLTITSFFFLKDSTFVQNNTALERFTNITVESGETRLTVWQIALQGIEEKPFLGWGQENFRDVFAKYYRPDLFDQEQWFDRAHNIFLDWGISGGIPAVIALIFISIAYFHCLWKRRTPLAIAERSVLSGAFVAYGIHGLFVFDSTLPLIFLLLLFAYVHWRSTCSEDFKNPEINKRTLSIGRIMVLSFVFVLCSFLFFENIKAIATAHHLRNAIEGSAYNIGFALEEFKKAVSIRSYAKEEVAEQMTIITAKVNPLFPLAGDFYQLTTAELANLLLSAPENARLHLLYGALARVYGKNDDALSHLEQAARLSPNKQSILFELGLTLIDEQRYAEACNVLESAYQLDESYEDARVFYIIAAIYLEELEPLTEYIQEKFEFAMTNSIPIRFDERIANALALTGKTALLIDLIEEATVLQPDNLEIQVLLARSHVFIGQRDVAASIIENAMYKHPAFYNTGYQFLKELNSLEK